MEVPLAGGQCPAGVPLGQQKRAREMKPIDEQDIAEPGLVVLDITGGSEDSVQAVMAALEKRWAISGIGPVHRDPGKPGVRARIYADVLGPGRECP
ncbi:DUF6207 family protein [Streptomyces sp. NBC_00273]|uniref:DUF6207 family protein n=1 Tax=Streptomyces sp. NBC_00273 TaxID=2903644 RepID=UPI002E2AA474|nr:DUF6207 family protein [Streptomyces sp. NBC_00273]